MLIGNDFKLQIHVESLPIGRSQSLTGIDHAGTLFNSKETEYGCKFD